MLGLFESLPPEILERVYISFSEKFPSEDTDWLAMCVVMPTKQILKIDKYLRTA